MSVIAIQFGLSAEESGVANLTWSVGSRWLRWDPHLHAPGTLRNDQFRDEWEAYIRKIENTQPAPHALGITDYFCIRTYKDVVRRRQAGALQRIPLVFPNVELRLTIETKNRSGVNLHLLVCPDDPEHVARIEEKLSQLRFRFLDAWYPCSEDGLKRLGRAHRRDSTLADGAALSEGANQFKVELSDVRRIFDEDSWMRSNVLVAVAAGNDGLAGIAQDASFRAQREELGRFADVVFSGNAKDRLYWLGDHPDFARNGQTPKPCLHGCDAHHLDDVLESPERRRCWIRSEPTFEGLRQTLLEPERRVHIGEEAPLGSSPGDVIHSFKVRNAPWFQNPELFLNDGLVTIIGAKGSGKTALAELLAFAVGAEDVEPSPASFIAKARNLLHGVRAELQWGDETQQSAILPQEAEDFGEPRVRYLSQQFVERLCSPRGLAEPLVEEIERVVFDAIDEEDRLQCSSFAELRSVMQEDPAAEQEAERQSIRTMTREIAEEIQLQKCVTMLSQKTQEAERDRKAIEKELASIPMMVSDEKLKAQQEAAVKLKSLKESIAAEERRAQELRDLAADVQRQLRASQAALEVIRLKYPTLLTADIWDLLRVRVADGAIPKLVQLEEIARQRALNLRNHGSLDPMTNGTNYQPARSEALVAKGLSALIAENDRLTKELGLDQAKLKRRADLEKRLATAKQHEDGIRKQLKHAEKAPERRRTVQVERLGCYEKLFRALVTEEEALEKLYRPLRDRITADPRLSKLSFFVHRVVDIEQWVTRGEALLDLRRPPFQGRGALLETVRNELLDPWRNGTPEAARIAMEHFIEEHASAALEILAQGVTPLDFGEWLFSTDHITVRYGIQYEGVEIAHLSPGTRGVVLLTLYLGLDDRDQRPLIIDQPEENLDPRSVYDDLVPFFRDGAKRRQIIMVTHNANLVVNTDSDQVIVAEAERESPTKLPKIRYLAGGLEDPEIRAHICSLLEGGEEAFKKRGQRYGRA